MSNPVLLPVIDLPDIRIEDLPYNEPMPTFERPVHMVEDASGNWVDARENETSLDNAQGSKDSDGVADGFFEPPEIDPMEDEDSDDGPDFMTLLEEDLRDIEGLNDEADATDVPTESEAPSNRPESMHHPTVLDSPKPATDQSSMTREDQRVWFNFETESKNAPQKRKLALDSEEPPSKRAAFHEPQALKSPGTEKSRLDRAQPAMAGRSGGKEHRSGSTYLQQFRNPPDLLSQNANPTQAGGRAEIRIQFNMKPAAARSAKDQADQAAHPVGTEADASSKKRKLALDAEEPRTKKAAADESQTPRPSGRAARRDQRRAERAARSGRKAQRTIQPRSALGKRKVSPDAEYPVAKRARLEAPINEDISSEEGAHASQSDKGQHAAEDKAGGEEAATAQHGEGGAQAPVSGQQAGDNGGGPAPSGTRRSARIRERTRLAESIAAIQRGAQPSAPSKKRKLEADDDAPVPTKAPRRETAPSGTWERAATGQAGSRGRARASGDRRGAQRQRAPRASDRDRARARGPQGARQPAAKSTGSTAAARGLGPKGVRKAAKPRADGGPARSTRPQTWTHDPSARTRAGAAAASNQTFAYLTQKGESATFRSSPGGRTFPLNT